MNNIKSAMSEQEFDRQTESIDRHAFRRRRVFRRIALIVLLCVVTTAVVWGAVYGCTRIVQHRQEVLAERTFLLLRDAKLAGRVEADGTVYTDIVTDMIGFSLENYDTVIVKLTQLDDDKINTFKKAFPKARRVVFEDGQFVRVVTRITSDDILAKNVSTVTKLAAPTGGSFVIGNTSHHYIYELNDYYYLEQRIDGEWYNLPAVPPIPLPKGAMSPAVTDEYKPPKEPTVIAPGQSFDLTIGWYSRYGNLPTGEYRMIKVLTVKTDKEKDETYQATYTIAVEFEIK